MKDLDPMEQCGQTFELAGLTMRCVLKVRHAGPHRASLSRPKPPESREDEHEEEVTLP